MGHFLGTTYWRMMGALFLNEETFEEVAKDPKATWQAIIVVLLGAAATAIHVPGGEHFLVFAVNVAKLVAWWVTLAMVLYFMASWLLRGWETKTTFGEFMRSAGFGMTPAILRALFVIPYAGEFIYAFGAVAWIFACLVVAIGNAFDVKSTLKVALIIGIGIVPFILIEPLILGPF